MWKWSCPAEPKIIWEHHSQTSANEMILAHILGVQRLNIKPCTLDPVAHKAEDDGIPCEGGSRGRICNIPYVRASSERR